MTTNSIDDIRLSKQDVEFINSEGGRPSLRLKLVHLFYKKGISLTVLEPGVFDYGIKRFGKKKDGYVVVYDYDKTTAALAKDYMKSNKDKEGYSIEDAYTDAYEWLDFNTVRSLRYMGENAPKMVYTDEEGKEQLI